MPEILEIEMYRRGALPVVGRRIEGVRAPDDWFLKNSTESDAQTALVGARIEGLQRVGKLLIVETTTIALGMRFGMTGRLVVNGTPVISALEYSTPRLDAEWVRFGLDLDKGARLDINDPRRLGGVTLAPQEHLGPDAWDASPAILAAALVGTRRAIKAALLDQKRIAGLGNLLVDELCWRAGVDPRCATNELGPERIARLTESIGPMLDELMERGGSTEGDHVVARHDGASCPRCGAPMVHDTVGGRSTWWCGDHQA